MKKSLQIFSVCLMAALPTVATAQSLKQELPALAERLNKALLDKGIKHAAVLDFTDLQGRPTELGRQLSEQLVVELVMTNGVSMADRANIKNILAEHKLTEEGLVKAENAKKLGEFAGVDAILTGTVSQTDAGWEVLVKAISTESATIAAAGRIVFAKTAENQTAGVRVIGNSTAAQSTGGESAGTVQIGGRDATVSFRFARKTPGVGFGPDTAFSGRFDATSPENIYLYLAIKFLSPRRDRLQVRIDCIWTGPNGTEIRLPQMYAWTEPGSATSWASENAGRQTPEYWRFGRYSVACFAAGASIGTGTFEIAGN